MRQIEALFYLNGRKNGMSMTKCDKNRAIGPRHDKKARNGNARQKSEAEHLLYPTFII